MGMLRYASLKVDQRCFFSREDKRRGMTGNERRKRHVWAVSADDAPICKKQARRAEPAQRIPPQCLVVAFTALTCTWRWAGGPTLRAELFRGFGRPPAKGVAHRQTRCEVVSPEIYWTRSGDRNPSYPSIRHEVTYLDVECGLFDTVVG